MSESQRPIFPSPKKPRSERSILEVTEHSASTTGGSSAVDLILSAESIAGNDDLVRLILLRLPLKPLTRSKSVSKHWLSLISDLHFSLLVKPTSAIFLQTLDLNPEFAFVPFSDTAVGSPNFDFFGQRNTRIVHSSNGLICYSKSVDHPDQTLIEYFVFNPTTNRSVKIPIHGTLPTGLICRTGVPHRLRSLDCNKPSCSVCSPVVSLLGVCLAFDPLRWTRYRVVSVSEFRGDCFHYEIQISVYKSESPSWSDQLGPFTVPHGLDYNNGVFWNGGMYWIAINQVACFFIDGGFVEVTKLPLNSGTSVEYFGASNDHLQVVVCERPWDGVLKVFEMGLDNSEWVMKHCCDIQPLMDKRVVTNLYSAIPLVFMEQGKERNDCRLVLGLRGEVVCYDFRNKSLKKLCDFPSLRYKFSWASGGCFKVFPFIETLCEV